MKTIKHSLLFIFTLVSTFCFTKNETYPSSSILTEDQFVEGSVIIAEDGRFTEMSTDPTWKSRFVNNAIYNTVTVEIDPDSRRFQSTAYEVTVELEVKYWEYDLSTDAFIEKIYFPAPMLKLEYTLEGAYNNKKLLRFSGGNRMEVKVVKITPTDPGFTGVMNLKLSSEISVERFYAFTSDIKPVAEASVDVSQNNITVSWSDVQGAEEYELQWTHVNDYEYEQDRSQIPFDENDFRHDNTRVLVKKELAYTFPAIYEKGFLVYRVRAIGKNPLDNYKSDVVGVWSGNTGYENLEGVVDKLEFSGHNTLLNWQYNITFTEDEKSKKSISYFDGSLRTRQSVSKINSENQAIVGETVYDHQGRPAVNALPVPTGASEITYYPNFNRNGDELPYNRTNFDIDRAPSAGNDCVVSADEMSNSSGASNYYSESNPDLSGPQAHLPDAQGYPFTQTVYTPDNTGRIKSQSGVGTDHKTGSGHDVKYFYGKPDQEELDRLFGSEVGDMEHYQKNMVVDPNGQVSVSYVDMSGRTIATALAGDTTMNLDALDSYFEGERNMDINLLGIKTPEGKLISQDLSQNGQVLTYSTEKLITSEQNRIYNYLLSGGQFQEYFECTDKELDISSFVCFNCIYDVELTLTNECGDQFLIDLDPSVAGSTTAILGETILESLRAGTYTRKSDDNLVSPEFLSGLELSKEEWATEGLLKLGNYTLSKKITLNAEGIDRYTDEYIKENICLDTYDEILDSAFAEIDFTMCIDDCDACEERLGDFDQYDILVTPNCEPCMTELEYEGVLEECRELCDGRDFTCETGEASLIAHMGVRGQYGKVNLDSDGQIDINSSGNATATDRLSIFNIGNSLSPNSYLINIALAGRGYGGGWRINWKYPIYETSSGEIVLEYVDETEEIAYVNVNLNDDGTFDLGFEGDPIERNGDLVIRVKQINNLKDLLSVWRPEWARSLILYHPEYSYLRYCRLTDASNIFNDDWMKAVILEQAPEGFMDPLGLGITGNSNLSKGLIDPYFDRQINPLFSQAAFNAMRIQFANYKRDKTGRIYSLPHYAYIIANCPYTELDEVNDGLCPSCAEDYLTNLNNTNLDPVDWYSDKAWDTYRSIYYSMKNLIFEQHRTYYTIDNNGYNACIGSEDYHSWNDPELRRSIRPDEFNRTRYWGWGNFQANNYIQTCSRYHEDLYVEKVKAYPTNDDLLGSSDQPTISSDVCYATVTPNDEEYRETSCPVYEELLFESDEDAGAFTFYENCGDCAQLFYLGNFFDEVFTEGAHMESPKTLSCYNASTGAGLAGYTPGIIDILGFDNSLEAVWQDAGGATTNDYISRVININQPGSVNNQIIDFRFDKSYEVTNNLTGDVSTYVIDWNDVERMCCLSHDEAPEYFNVVDNLVNNYFNGKAIVTINKDLENEFQVKLPFEGFFSNVDVRTCDVPHKCSINEQLNEDLNGFFSSLTQEIVTTPSFGSLDLDEEIPVILEEDIVVNEPIFLPELGTVTLDEEHQNALPPSLLESFPDSDWEWIINSQSSTELNASIVGKDKTNGTELVNFGFVFRLPDDEPGVTFDDFVSFSNSYLRLALTGGIGTSQKVTTFALIKYAAVPEDTEKVSRRYIRIEVESQSSILPLGECVEAQFSAIEVVK